MANKLECKTCGTDRPEYDVVVCSECREKAICCDCATELQRELLVCSDDCAVKAIKRTTRRAA